MNSENPPSSLNAIWEIKRLEILIAERNVEWL